MATTTLNTMLPAFGRTIGAFIGSFTTTTAIGATGSLTVVISTELKDSGFTNDDALNDTFIKITSANNDDTVRRVTDYTASSGTITISGTDLTNDSSTNATFELYRYDPDQLRDTLNDARLQSFPRLYKEVLDRALTGADDILRYPRPSSIPYNFVRQLYVENRLEAKTFANNIVNTLNCDFESSTIGDDWTTSNITLAAEADTTTPDNWVVFEGSQSGKCTVSASSTATILMTVPSGTNYVGEEINIGIWVYSKTASRVSAAIQLDSASVSSSSDTHSGNGWERLTHTLVADGVSTSIKVGLSATSGTAFVFYADQLIVTAGPANIPQLLGARINTWREEGDDITLIQGATSDRNILVRGMGHLSSVSSGSDTMEIDERQARYLYNVAATLWFQQDIDQLDVSDLNAAQRRYTHFANLVAQNHGAMAPIALYKGVV
jgi:hypothetical protein